MLRPPEGGRQLNDHANSVHAGQQQLVADKELDLTGEVHEGSHPLPEDDHPLHLDRADGAEIALGDERSDGLRKRVHVDQRVLQRALMEHI